jgi:hypothetical protein
VRASCTPLFCVSEGQFLQLFCREIAPRIRRGHKDFWGKADNLTVVTFTDFDSLKQYLIEKKYTYFAVIKGSDKDNDAARRAVQQWYDDTNYSIVGHNCVGAASLGLHAADPLIRKSRSFERPNRYYYYIITTWSSSFGPIQSFSPPSTPSTPTQRSPKVRSVSPLLPGVPPTAEFPPEISFDAFKPR